MKKTIITLIIISMLIISGCSYNNQTEQTCKVFEHSSKKGNETRVYMDGEVCIIETVPNHNRSIVISCESIRTQMDIIIKTNESTPIKEIKKEIGFNMKLWCDVYEI